MFKNRLFFKNVPKQIFTRFEHQEHIIRIHGHTINTVEVGQGTEGLLLLPGTLGTAWTNFGPQLEGLPELMPNHKIFAWDPPGYGKSVPPDRDWSTKCFENDAKLAVNTMRARNCEKFSILGWSAGAFTALIIAGRYPEFVDRLVIWGAGTYLNKADVNALEALKDLNNWSQGMREPFEKIYGKSRFLELLPKSIDCLSSFYKERNGDICSQEAKLVKAPTFLLRGAKDMINSPEHVPYLLDVLPCVRYYEFPDGKHNIHLRYPEEFNKLVAKFLLEKEENLRRMNE